ncbi:MAG: type II toxin-antitoxin system Phd/YefM family antitoxin [Elusimicrobiota bacterium]|nr:type II toxin-antitoxin system Phd/YefM family antitoxin [Elusimicrobiota bacterium]
MKKPRASRYIGSFEAKTRLSELLRDAENGTAYVIRRRGKDVARLLPPPATRPTRSPWPS